MPYESDTANLTRIEARPVSPSIGAEIAGVDLAKDVDDAIIAELRAALLKHKVLFFRDQAITRAQHIAFARRFGPLEIHPATPKDQGDLEVLRIAHGPNSRGRENMWHSDVTWRPEPSLGSILRAVEIPPVGGDTLFSDMYAAFDSLSPGMQEWVCTLSAVHDYTLSLRRLSGAEADELRAKHPPQTHPVVRTHPETGRRGLYVNAGFVSHIQGLSGADSKWLLDHLYAQAAIPEHQCRLSWRPNTLAFWDNRACQHYAVSDYFPAVRVMERVTIAGDRPYLDPAR